MEIIKNCVHFNTQELAQLREKNPTLYEIAEHIPECLTIANGEFVYWVHKAGGYDGMVCPHGVFWVDDAVIECGEEDIACDEFHCWGFGTHQNGNGEVIYPCWNRRWNDYEHHMKTGKPMYWGEVIAHE